MGIDTAAVVRRMNAGGEDPADYDELCAAWNALCEQALCESGGDFQFADVESAAIAALSRSHGPTKTGHVGNDVSRMLGRFDYPTYLVMRDGRIAAMNRAASRQFDIGAGERIDALPFRLHRSERLSELIAEKLRSASEAVDQEAVLKRACVTASDQEVTVAVSASCGRIPMALVFVIATDREPDAIELLKEEFGLSDAETQILASFVDGHSSRDIAGQRGRAHATIRTQFQSLLNKTGARNQTELLRICLAVSGFCTGFREIADAVSHPHRRSADVLRVGGRRVEVTLMGDVSGKPILSIANASNYTFNARVEEGLFTAGLCLIAVCAPGCGRTDRAPAGQSRLQCIARDIEAILDQLEVPSCLMMAYNASSPLCCAVARHSPERFSHVVQIAACVPSRFNVSHRTVSPWVSGILRAGVDHPAMKRMLFIGAVKAWVILGARQFMRLQMSSNSPESGCVLLAENVREYENALETATRGGTAAAAEDLALTFEDWTSDLEALPIRMTVVHGARDNLVRIESVRGLADRFPDQLELIEIADAGFPLLQSHTRQMVEILRSLACGSVADSASALNRPGTNPI